MNEESSDPTPHRRWISTLLTIVIVGMLIDVAIGLVIRWRSGHFPLPVLAVFLILSGIRLVGVAIDTAQRARDRSDIGHGWGWVAYKLVAAAVAFAGAAYLLFSDDAGRLQRFLG